MIFDPDTRKISLACNEPDEEDIITDPEGHYRELVDHVKSVYRKIKKAPIESFPEFLWEPAQNDFSDDVYVDHHQYIDMGIGRIEAENGSEIMNAVGKLKNRYKNYFDYIDALAVWERYRNFIEDTYGDFEYFGYLFENGVTSYQFKRKPKLKNAKKNRHLLEIDVPISRINPNDSLSITEIAELCNEMPDQIEIYDDYYEYVTYLSEYNKKEEKRMQREDRIKNCRRVTTSGLPEIGAITNYLTNDSKAEAFKYGANRDRPLSEDIEAFHEYDGLEEDLKRDAMGLRNTVSLDTISGIYVTKTRTQDEIDVYTTLAANGYDVSGLMTNTSMDRTAMKLISESVSKYDDSFTSKKAKKMRKKRAKNEKKLIEALTANESVRKIMTKNRVTFDTDENMLSFTLKDILVQ